VRLISAAPLADASASGMIAVDTGTITVESGADAVDSVSIAFETRADAVETVAVASEIPDPCESRVPQFTVAFS
jgi:hypothetical protein